MPNRKDVTSLLLKGDIDPCTNKCMNLKAVLLSDGRWYEIDEATVPKGSQGYLSFVQIGRDMHKIAHVRVPLTDIKAVAFHSVPHATI